MTRFVYVVMYEMPCEGGSFEGVFGSYKKALIQKGLKDNKYGTCMIIKDKIR